LFDKKWQIYSGLLGTQVDRFLAVLKERPVEVLEVLDENLWFAVLARRRE
jgi:ribosomal protein L11 methylase PrmA